MKKTAGFILGTAFMLVLPYLLYLFFKSAIGLSGDSPELARYESILLADIISFLFLSAIMIGVTRRDFGTKHCEIVAAVIVSVRRIVNFIADWIKISFSYAVKAYWINVKSYGIMLPLYLLLAAYYVVPVIIILNKGVI